MKVYEGVLSNGVTRGAICATTILGAGITMPTYVGCVDYECSIAVMLVLANAQVSGALECLGRVDIVESAYCWTVIVVCTVTTVVYCLSKSRVIGIGALGLCYFGVVALSLLGVWNYRGV